MVGERSGSVAILTAFGFIALVGCVGIAVDTSIAYAVKARLGAALDAAALAGARAFASPTRDADIQNFFSANFPPGYLGSTLEPLDIDVNNTNRTITVTARATAPAYFMRVLGHDFTNVAASAEATLSSRDVEVSLVLDVTLSMNTNNRITHLKTAAKELVDIVVQDLQEPFFSKVAIVPYSMGVNVGTLANQVRGTVSSGTCTYPAEPTCEEYEFPRMGGGSRTHDISTCVTERPGPHLYTDASPSLAPLGKNYPGPAESLIPCLTPTIVPLSSNKEALKAAITNLQTSGSTAGHIGVAWGWYMISPNFGYLWPGEGEAVPYNTINLGQKVLKVVVIMTDGEFNTVYSNGVIAKNSLYGSGGNQYKINQDATHGSSHDQANALCDAMKAEGVEIYTVGLEVASLPAAQSFVNDCATSPNHVYLPNTGTELREAFRDIAAQVSNLRISQ